jgi:hypothetical protein
MTHTPPPSCGAARRAGACCALGLLLFAVGSANAAAGGVPESPALFGIPVDFILFALTLLGVAVFHHYTLQVALTGVAVIAAYKLAFTGFKTGAGLAGLAIHLQH